jgi:hypothetical protein
MKLSKYPLHNLYLHRILGSTRRLIFLLWVLAMVSFINMITMHYMMSYGTLQLKKQRLSPNQTCPALYIPAGHHTRIEAMTFGFDAKTNDYKIINFFSISDHRLYYSPSKRGVIHQKELYNLRADSWRKVDGPPCFLSNHDIVLGHTSTGWLLGRHMSMIRRHLFCHWTREIRYS